MNRYNVNVTGHSHPRYARALLCGACHGEIPKLTRVQQVRLVVDGTPVRVILCPYCAPSSSP